MTGLLDLWWVWLCAALVLAIAEVLLPGFIFLGIAIGAVGIALLVAIAPGLSPALMTVLFAGLSLAAWLGLKRVFRARDGAARVIHDDINK
ncbi:MAG: hypothetical protein AAF965_09190 [Pseudomonadota bacterium]